jgi:site-specific DNA recombinase
MHCILHSRFYLGLFRWRGREYQGIHPPLVDFTTFGRVQDIISGRNANKCKPNMHNFPFAGLLSCSEDKCRLTAELHRKKYIYYRCSFGRGKHKAPYIPEARLADMLGSVLKQVEVPSGMAQSLLVSIRDVQAKTEVRRLQEIDSLDQQLSVVKNLKQKAYRDKLAGLIDEEFWLTNMSDRSTGELKVQEARKRTSRPISCFRTAKRMG